jgi:nucleoside-diphosphate-sugar epimerase
MKILVTGATGFVGGALVRHLVSDKGYEVIAAVREPNENLEKIVRCVKIAGLAIDTNWQEALTGVEVVIHAAARVHIMRETVADPLDEFRKTNVQGTLNLARQAASAGIRRFIFISSVKANGETTEIGKPFTADAIPVPLDAYGISKMEAENGLKEIAQQTGMELVIIRPPLIYGSGAKGNFATLVKLVKLGLPLPFGSLSNKRSLASIDNLVDLIAVCIRHENAKNQIFMVSDGEDLSTAELIKKIGKALGKPAMLIPFPKLMINLLLRLIGKTEISHRICGSLQVDISKTRQLLNWKPVLSVDNGLRKAVNN